MSTTERDDLAKLIDQTINAEYCPGDDVMGRDLAPILIAAGYRKTSTIATTSDLLALPEGSVVIDREGDVSQKRDNLWCGYEMAPVSSRKLANIASPFTVLHEGSEAT